MSNHKIMVDKTLNQKISDTALDNLTAIEERFETVEDSVKIARSYIDSRAYRFFF